MLGWLGIVRTNGQFRVVIEELRPGKSQLRLVFANLNGTRSVFPFDYTVDATGRPELSRFEEGVILDKLAALYVQRDGRQLATQIQELQQRQPRPTNLLARAQHLQRLLNPAPLVDLATVSPNQKHVGLSSLKLAQEKVGWGAPPCAIASSGAGLGVPQRGRFRSP